MKYDKEILEAHTLLTNLARKLVDDPAVSGKALSRLEDARQKIAELGDMDVFRKRKLKKEHYV